MKDIVIDYELIKNIDISEIKSLSVTMQNQFDEGPQPYHFYAYVSTLFNNANILDIGTEWGHSALALAYNSTNSIMSYDIKDHNIQGIKKSNIKFKIGNFMEDDIDYKNISIILIDVDPHDSIQERKMIKFLQQKKWQGLLLLDDVGSFFPHMNIWFHTIPYEKYLLDTSIGHYSGTGLVNFGNKYNIILKHN